MRLQRCARADPAMTVAVARVSGVGCAQSSAWPRTPNRARAARSASRGLRLDVDLRAEESRHGDARKQPLVAEHGMGLGCRPEVGAVEAAADRGAADADAAHGDEAVAIERAGESALQAGAQKGRTGPRRGFRTEPCSARAPARSCPAQTMHLAAARGPQRQAPRPHFAPELFAAPRSAWVYNPTPAPVAV